jgi:hypothetical protein
VKKISRHTLYYSNPRYATALEDEEGHEYNTTYLTGDLCGANAALSAGWRRFANQHKLVDGDCLVFHLIETTKFKVRVIYILRNRMPESSMELARWLIGNLFYGCFEEILPNNCSTHVSKYN